MTASACIDGGGGGVGCGGRDRRVYSVGFREFVGGRFGGATPASGNPLLDVLVPLLANRRGGGLLGGLTGVLGSFARAGLGKKADSWVASGTNENVSADEVERALGSDAIAKVAARAGVSAREASVGLAVFLPALIDQLTPGGAVPADLRRAARALDLAAIVERVRG